MVAALCDRRAQEKLMKKRFGLLIGIGAHRAPLQCDTFTSGAHRAPLQCDTFTERRSAPVAALAKL